MGILRGISPTAFIPGSNPGSRTLSAVILAINFLHEPLGAAAIEQMKQPNF